MYQPAPTMVKTGNSRMMTGNRVEAISPIEATRFSSFPDQYKFPGRASEVIERVGNSVPPLLMFRVAQHIKENLFMHQIQKMTSSRRPYVEVLDDLWTRHLAQREPDAPTVVSLFAGAGGSSLGYSAAGFRELLAVEWDKHACQCLRQNFPGLTVYEGDISKLTTERALELAGITPGELDVLDGSPPCQSFSTAGKRDMNDPRGQLFREYVRMLGIFRPKVFVMENVSGMVKGKMKLIFAEILRTLRGAGYEVGAWLLNAMHYGIPQSRERMIFVGVRSDLVGAGPGVPPGSSRGITFREAVEGCPDVGGKVLGEFLQRMAQSQPRGLWSSHLGIWRRLKGNDADCMSTKWCSWDDTPGTVTKEWISLSGMIHPWRERYLSAGEVKRIGSWPDQYFFVGKFGDIVRRVGNSVPPLLMDRISQHVRREILSKLKHQAPF